MPEGQLSQNIQLKKQHDGLDLHMTSQSAEQLRVSSFKKNAPQMKGSLSGMMLQRDVYDMRGRAAQHLAGTRGSHFITQGSTSDIRNIM